MPVDSPGSRKLGHVFGTASRSKPQSPAHVCTRSNLRRPASPQFKTQFSLM
jgi:hypothetical protein